MHEYNRTDSISRCQLRTPICMKSAPPDYADSALIYLIAVAQQ